MEEEVKSPAVKTSEQIDEKPWVFLEKELREFEKVMKQLEEGEFQLSIESKLTTSIWQLFYTIFNHFNLTTFLHDFRSGIEFNIH